MSLHQEAVLQGSALENGRSTESKFSGCAHSSPSKNFFFDEHPMGYNRYPDQALGPPLPSEALHVSIQRLIEFFTPQVLGNDDAIRIDQEIHRDGIHPVDARSFSAPGGQITYMVGP